MVRNSIELEASLLDKNEQHSEIEQSLIETMEQYQGLSSIKGREELINLLGYVSLLSRITVAALEAFEGKEWHRFDALVGDCGCQMRAAKIKVLADLFMCSKEWRQIISEIKEEAQTILQLLPIHLKQIEANILNDTDFTEKYGTKIAASVVCMEFEILQKLPIDIRFIIESFLLTETKMVTPRNDRFYKSYYEATNPSLLATFNSGLPTIRAKNHEKTWWLPKKDLKEPTALKSDERNAKKVGVIGKNKLIQLVRVMQRDLASLSIGYTCAEAKKLKPSKANLYAQIICDEYIRNDEISRPCIPLFYCMEILMQRIIDNSQHILVDITRWTSAGQLVEHLKLLYVGNPTTKSLQMVPLNENNLPECVIVFTGCSVREDQEVISSDAYIQLFNSVTFEEILNALAAQHPQYPGKMDEKFPLPVDFRFSSYVKRAEKIGCTLEDMSLFMITHIYCENLKNNFIK